MNVILSPFSEIENGQTNISYTQEQLQGLPCGLHRVSLDQAPDLFPEFQLLYESVPVSDPSEWEIDLKIHMLMEGMFPCIPNWHCDNVPRGEDGKVRYNNASPEQKMMLWISGGPHTEFLKNSLETRVPTSHSDLANIISDSRPDTVHLPAQQWVHINQLTPHRGVASDTYQWRVFARVTHKSIISARPVLSHIRRHAQVYLPHDFSW